MTRKQKVNKNAVIQNLFCYIIIFQDVKFYMKRFTELNPTETQKFCKMIDQH